MKNIHPRRFVTLPVSWVFKFEVLYERLHTHLYIWGEYTPLKGCYITNVLLSKEILDERIYTPVRTMEIIHHWNDVPLPESWMSKILSHMEKYTPVRIMEL